MDSRYLILVELFRELGGQAGDANAQDAELAVALRACQQMSARISRETKSVGTEIPEQSPLHTLPGVRQTLTGEAI